MPANPDIDIAIMMMTYNSAADVTDALKAITAQTYQDFHLVYVDDCSPDGTYDRAQDFTAMFPSASFSKNAANKGVLTNLRDTLRKVEAEARHAKFFVWACADDVWEPDFLVKTRKHLLEHPDAMICQTWFDTYHQGSGKKSAQKLSSIKGNHYTDAARIFQTIKTEEGTATYNFALHGLMRMPMMRVLYPDNAQKIANSTSTELSGLACVLSHGSIDILQETLIHRTENGRFADKNPQDPFSRYYENIPLRARSVFQQFPHMLASKGKNMSTAGIFLMWWRVLLFYVVAPTYTYVKRLIIGYFSPKTGNRP